MYPWEVAVAPRVVLGDSALNHLEGTVASIIPLGNRVRLRVGPIVAEITAASAERLSLGRGDVAAVSFKASATRLVPIAARQRPVPPPPEP